MKIRNEIFLKSITAVTVILLLFLAAPATLRGEEDFAEWRQDFITEARQKGISDTTLTLLEGVKPDAAIRERFKKDRQPEFSVDFIQYKNWFVNEKMIQRGVKKYNTLQDTLTQIENEFEVPAEYLLAIWGLESRFGSHKNTHNILDSLVTLAYSHPRSRSYFRNQLLSYLEMHENEYFPLIDLKGSWAGAMGQPQFMPSSYLHYAVDFTGSGWADIWNSEVDILASIANYISQHNWQKNQGWGRKLAEGENLPEGKRLVTTGDTNELRFAVTGNFRAIFSYNRSNHYALTICHLADAIAEKIKPKKQQ